MKFRVTLFSRLLLPIIFTFVCCGLLLVIFTRLGLGKGLTKYFESQLEPKVQMYKVSLNSEKKQIQDTLPMFKEIVSLPVLIENKNKKELKKELLQIQKASDLTNAIIVDTKGNVLVEGSDESIVFTSDAQVKFLNDVLSGKEVTETIRLKKQIAFMGGTPIYRDGKIIAGIIIEKSITDDAIIEKYKKIYGTELTIFVDNMRLSTTICDEKGRKLVGTLLNNQEILKAVYQDGKDYIGKNLIDKKNYLTIYFSLPISGNEEKAMCFMGLPMSMVDETQSMLLKTTVPIVVLMCLIIMILLFLCVSRFVLNPLKGAAKAIHNLSLDSGDSDLTFKINIHRNDEIGHLCEDINKFIDKQRNLVVQLKKAEAGLNHIGETLGNSSTESASAIAEILATISGVHTQIGHQAVTLDKANQLIDKTLDGVKNLDGLIENQSAGIVQSSASIEQMVGNINSVSNSIDKMSSQFEELIKVSAEGQERQTEVDTRVHKIADQSKMLLEANTIISQIAEQTS